MARRNFGQERREAIARARGFPVPYEDARGTFRVPRQAFYQWRQTVAGHPATERRRTFAGGRELVRTRDEGQLRAAIERAARGDKRLYASVLFLRDPEDGSHPREWWPLQSAEIWQHGGYAAANAVDQVDALGTAFALFKATLDETDKYPGVVIEVQLRIEEV